MKLLLMSSCIGFRTSAILRISFSKLNRGDISLRIRFVRFGIPDGEVLRDMKYERLSKRSTEVPARLAQPRVPFAYEKVASREVARASRLLLKLAVDDGKQLTAAGGALRRVNIRAILPFYDNVISARLPMS